MSLAEVTAKLFEQISRDDSDTYSPLTFERIRLHDTKGPDRSMLAAFDAFCRFLQESRKTIAHTTEFLTNKQSNCFALWRYAAWTALGGLIIPVERPSDAPRTQKGSRGLSSFYMLSSMGIFVRDNPNAKVLAGNIRRTRHPDLTWSGWYAHGEKVSLAQAQKARLKTNVSSMIVDGSVLI